MPKIIENVREQLLAEAKRQIDKYGYAQTTVRSVASACGLGVGTVYNYFESKEMLIATFVYEEWKQYLAEMHRLPTDDPHVLLKGIFDSLVRFAAENKKLFSDADAAKLVSVGSSGQRHKMLRLQIADFVRPICESQFCAEFIAESVICWSMEHAEFESVYPLLEKIIKK
ncbi:MAG: TetR/AcrR family transcriptional regulator [Clostridia bacterium]|nr:TetR/AcrR family transcriptional regulator [Clostridia bacterium]